jgi:hypothetical protein
LDAQKLHKFAFHLTRVGSDPLGAREQDWATVVELTRQWLNQPGTTRETSLLRLLQQAGPALLARRLPENYRHLLHTLETTLKAAPKPDGPPALRPTDVEQLALLLQGRVLLVIGGDPKPEHCARLKQALGLAEVLWPETSEIRPELRSLEPLIARDEVALVVLLIRWIRHALNDVSDLCVKHDKPLARITGGYSVNQIATQALAQCGRRLES